jgi:hypothetical protein
MHQPLFATLNASSAVKAIFGSNPLRVYPFGEAPQGVTLPYVVFQTVAGSPENYLNQTPDMDAWTPQVDVYASTPTAAYAGAQAVRDALEPVAHITAWRGESRDPDTNHYRYSFDVDFMTPR